MNYENIKLDDNNKVVIKCIKELNISMRREKITMKMLLEELNLRVDSSSNIEEKNRELRVPVHLLSRSIRDKFPNFPKEKLSKALRFWDQNANGYISESEINLMIGDVDQIKEHSDWSDMDLKKQVDATQKQFP